MLMEESHRLHQQAASSISSSSHAPVIQVEETMQSAAATSPEGGRTLRARKPPTFKHFFEDDFAEDSSSGKQTRGTRGNRNRIVVDDEDDMDYLRPRFAPRPKPNYDIEKLEVPNELQQSNVRITRGRAQQLVEATHPEHGNDEEYQHEQDAQDHSQMEGGKYGLRNRRNLVTYNEKRLMESAQQLDSPDVRRDYALRPRNEPKNYKVRLPLFEASPKKAENRRRNDRFSQFKSFGDDSFHGGGAGGRFGFKFGARNFGSMLLGPSEMGGDDSDDDLNSGAGASRDNRRVADLRVAELGPINRGALGGDDIERLLLGKRAATGLGAKSLSDSDPLGVDQAVDFSKVGGLDEHIRSLKEMIVLPLLYPEVFAKFNLTPPRGVLFHGPPGTGKLSSL
jgi:hypothetical protein